MTPLILKQGIIPKDFLDQVRAGQASLDDLPFREPLIGDMNMRFLVKGAFGKSGKPVPQQGKP